MHRAIEKLGLSMRAYHRILKVVRTMRRWRHRMSARP
ncbi:MAG: hypothetical protein AB2552_20535 [Candidatus Thiodiazotropha endolucinida]